MGLRIACPPASTPSLARPPKNTSHEMTVASFTPLGSSSTAGPVPATASRGTRSVGAPSAWSSPRSGMYSPKGTRRTFSYRLMTSPPGVTTTWALMKWSPSGVSSVMPTANGAPMRFASAATSPSSRLPSNWRTSMTFSGHTTRSTEPGSIAAVAARWRCSTSSAEVSVAWVPCGPPPCTAATRSVSHVWWPLSLSAIIGKASHTTIATAKAITPCHSPRAVMPRLRASWGTTGDGPASANPTWNTNQVSSSAPPTLTIGANGPAAWPIARLASGTPPKGKQNLKASASVCAAGRPTTRHGPRGATQAATAWKPANIEAATR